MTDSHIRCVNDEWEYPNHEALLKKCRLHPIELYIQRRRGTLWNYLLKNKKDLLEETMKIRPHSKDGTKVLWWKQKYLEKLELVKKENYWFRRRN